MKIVEVRISSNTVRSGYEIWAQKNSQGKLVPEEYISRPSGEVLIFSNCPTVYRKATMTLNCDINADTHFGYPGADYTSNIAGVTFQYDRTIVQGLTGTGQTISYTLTTRRASELPPVTSSAEHDNKLEMFNTTVNGTIVFEVEIPDATITNLTYVGNFWEKHITVNWRSTYQTGYEYELYYNNTIIGSGAGGIGTSFVIPANTFTGTLPASVRVRTYNQDNTGVKHYSSWSEQNISLQDITARISDLFVLGNQWEFPINLSWQSTDQQQFRIDVLKNNVIVKTYVGTTAKAYTIPAGELSSGEHVFKVTVGYANRFVNSQTKSVTLKDIEATISNLIVTGEYWEKDIALSWQSIDQEQFKIEIFKDNILVQTYTGAADNRFIIPAETLTPGTYVFKVTVGYANRFVNSSTKNITLKDVTPTVANVSLSGSNIDYNLTLSWQSTDQKKYEVEVLKGEELKNSPSGTLDKQVTFPNNTLETGNYTFKVRVGYKDRWSEWAKTTIVLVESFPSIGAFEPDGVIRKKEEEIRIWWTSTNQSSWEIKIDDSITYTGTYETEKILTSNSLTVGNHKITLTVFYRTPLGVEKKESKTVEFKVQGKPPLPTFTSGNMFMTSLPVISWDTQEQQGYILDILKDDVLLWSTKWQNGLVTRQKVLRILKDGTYKARLKIINISSVESDYAIQEFTINTSEATEINLEATQEDRFVRLRWNNINDTFNTFFVVRDGTYIAKLKDTYYDDYTACNEHGYTIVGLNFNNAAKYSNSVCVSCDINGCVMATVDNLTDIINVGHVVNNYSFGGSIGISGEAIYCTGREKPMMVWGEHVQATYTIKFVDYENYFRFTEMCKRRQVFCYRDRNQKLFLGVNSPKYDLDNIMAEYDITALEVDYSEVVDID